MGIESKDMLDRFDYILWGPAGVVKFRMLGLMIGFFVSATCLAGTVRAELLCYEGFAYIGSPLQNQQGGSGWDGPWYGQISGGMLAGSSNLDVAPSASLETHAVYTGGFVGYTFTDPLVPIGGRVAEPAGAGGTAYRYLGPETCLDMNVPGTYYISYSFRRDDASNTGAAEWTYVNLLALDATGQTQVVSIKTFSNEAWAVEMNDVSEAQTEPAQLELNKTYFVVVKIVTMDNVSPGNHDQIFLKVYDTETPVEINDIGFDAAYWTLIGNTDINSDKVVNVIVLGGATGTGFSFDEIRVGTTWEDVVSPQQESCEEFGEDCLPADVNRDGFVNLLDFAELAGDWTDCTDYAFYECGI